MKIKHFQGYGLVNAEKLKKTTINDPFTGGKQTVLLIKVSGDHEYGLEPAFKDNYTIYEWLVKKFDKTVKEEPREMTYTTSTLNDGNCLYSITYVI